MIGQEIIDQLQQGEEQAYRRLVEEWQDKVYNTAVSIIQNEEDADEVTQDVFIKVFRSIHSFKGDSAFSTWLYRITVNQSLDRLRTRKRKKRVAFVENWLGFGNGREDEPAEFNHPGIILENRERAVELFNALRQLPDKQRIAFTLHKMEAMRHHDISTIMNLSVTAVESLIARAKDNLRKILNDYYKKNEV